MPRFRLASSPQRLDQHRLRHTFPNTRRAILRARRAALYWDHLRTSHASRNLESNTRYCRDPCCRRRHPNRNRPDTTGPARRRSGFRSRAHNRPSGSCSSHRTRRRNRRRGTRPGRRTRGRRRRSPRATSSRPRAIGPHTSRHPCGCRTRSRGRRRRRSRRCFLPSIRNHPQRQLSAAPRAASTHYSCQRRRSLDPRRTVPYTTHPFQTRAT